MGVRAKDIMTADLICANEDMSVQELAQLLRDNNITGAPVVDGKGMLVGVVSVSDILLKDEVFGEEPHLDSDYQKQAESSDEGLLNDLSLEDVGDQKVRDIMSSAVITAQQDAPVEDLAGVMHSNRIHRVIILEGERLAGIVSTMDILRAVMDRRIS